MCSYTRNWNFTTFWQGMRCCCCCTVSYFSHHFCYFSLYQQYSNVCLNFLIHISFTLCHLQFEQLLKPGLHCLPWPCATIQNRVSLKIQQLDVKCETKTRDNVFVHLTTSILYQVQPSKAYEANYSLVNPRSQISAHVLNIVRSVVPTLKLDHVFLSSKSDISLEVSRSLQGFMNKYGYDILNVLVQDIQPEEKVKKSMNEIMSAKKWKQAMVHKAEGEKIKKVKDAEAHAEVLYLHGVGISKERTEISHGLRDAMINFTSSNDDTSIKNTAATSKDVMDILVLSHYFDTLASIGSNRVLLHMDPGELKELRGQLSPFFAKASNDGEADGGNSVVDIPDFLW
uniref:Band 7 domain-containing protein n=1 Tax=Ditylum brightwellii TaxID=49249 RepID=A0A6S9HFK4_9STRA|mmetsp:Transcript_2062/g.3142  ORF Transcript_2062/g.3142 Transcript_2062/m.3142 type:complete len:342 (+) Transcript_2062:528-1553(+)